MDSFFIAKYTYDAWGNHKIHYLDGTNFVAIDSTSCYNNSDPVNKQISTLNPFRYRGYYFDCETGLYYLNSRYYDPEIGRFINADDISVLDLTNVAINGLNLYAYCLNNPVNEVDENGYIIWWIVIAVIAVTAVAVTASVLGQSSTNNGKINVWQVLFDGLVGALGSLLMITGLGPLGMALWSGAFGFFGSIGSEWMAGKGFADMDWTGILINTVLGFVAGIASGAGLNHISKFEKSMTSFTHTKKTSKILSIVNDSLFGSSTAYKFNMNAAQRLNQIKFVTNLTVSLSFFTRALNFMYLKISMYNKD